MEASRAWPPAPDDSSRRQVEAFRHSLLALIDLNRGLSRATSVHGVVDSLLLNLMGQVGTPRAALWLRTQQDVPVLVRCHGIERTVAIPLLSGSWAEVARAAHDHPRPMGAAEIDRRLGAALLERVNLAAIELLAPIRAESALLGLVALGPRADERPYDQLAFEMVEASIAIAGVALENARLGGQAQESNRSLRIANAELRELDRAKSEFANNVGHELRTPLSVMLGCLDCLKDYDMTAQQSRLLVTRARDSAARLAEQVESLLTLAQADARSLSLELSAVNLSEFLPTYVAERQPGISAGLRELHLTGRAANARARCDARRLRQVLDELVDNAVKFTPEGSQIRVSLGDHVSESRPWLRIEVEDDGPGIPAEWLPNVFERFSQLDGSTTRPVGGLGIGLATAKTLAEAMGGRLMVDSAPDRGAVFSLLLPIA